MINTHPIATSSSVLGPFHISNALPMEIGADFKRHYEGDVILVDGKVKDIERNAIIRASLDIWQTAPNGLYSSQDVE